MFDLITAQEESSRFSVPAIAAEADSALGGVLDCGELLRTLRRQVPATTYRYLLQALIRQSFLIEVDVGGGGTRFDARWGDRLPTGDPRVANYTTCTEVLRDLLAELVEQFEHDRHREVISNFQAAKLIPYEVPIDYGQITEPMHRPGNLSLLWDSPLIDKAIALRAAVRDPELVGPEVASAVGEVLRSKIKVKTYLTDRALTGAFKTNREKRWEAHPLSPQFAFRRDCLLIEQKLLSQLIHMDGFPAPVRTLLIRELGLQGAQRTRCPITLEPIDFAELVGEVLDPTHGKSRFQVGHMNPLKSGAEAAEHEGHTPANVSWISEDGNRIQGSLSLSAVRSLLDRIAHNYARADD